MKRYVKPSELTKKLIALGIAGTMAVLGLTACNTQNNTNQSTSAYTETTTTNNGTTPVVEEHGVEKLASLVKKMINETYAQNFDYYVKNVTITGLNVKKAEAPQVDYAPGVYADYAESENAIIDISYVAESVNKQTGEEKVVSNDISYTVSGQKALEVAEQGVDNMEIETVADAIVESTQEKIEQEQETGANENDNIAGTQLSKKEEMAKSITERLTTQIASDPTYQQYLNNGYKIKSILRNSVDNEATSKIVAAAAYFDYLLSSTKAIDLKMPLGVVGFINEKGRESISFEFNIVSEAENESGDKQYITQYSSFELAISEEDFSMLYDAINRDTNGKIDEFFENNRHPEGEEFITIEEIKGSYVLGDDVYDKIANIVSNATLIDFYIIPTIKEQQELTNKEQLALNALNVENNPLVVVTEPTEELGKQIKVRFLGHARNNKKVKSEK